MTADDDYAEDLRGWHAEDQERPLYPPPSAPYDVAKKLYEVHRRDDGRTLTCWRGNWMRWNITHWLEIDAAELRSWVYDVLGDADYQKKTPEGDVVRVPWDPTKHKVANVMEALAAIGHLLSDVDPPAWLVHSAEPKTPAAQMISCTNGLLDLSTRELVDHTPALFNVVSVPFAYDAAATEPQAWFEFLDSVWHNDSESIALLQEYFGYVLSGRTDMQKMLLLIGPTRSGKGTIARLLTQLVGRGHVAGPTLASLGTNFGLSPLLGRPLAIVSDARLGNVPSHTVVERLLSITGEDMLTVDRKYREPWSGKLPTRFVVISNELPRFKDSSAAIANRLLILQMTQSFLHREDRTLDARLRAELPGILRWALDGLDRLTQADRFTVPDSSRDAANLMADLVSPVSAFVRELCVRGSDANVLRDDLYTAWQSWAQDNGHHAGAKSTFGRDLRAVVPELKSTQPRINGVQVRQYERIGLKTTSSTTWTHNGQTHVSPVSASSDTGHPVSPDGVNPQLSDSDTGDTGTTPLWVQQEWQERSSCVSGSNSEVRTCKCGNPLPSPEAVNSGRCKPCRDKAMAGYDR